MGLLALGVTTGSPQALDVPQCKQADAWVDAHRDNLPSTLEALQPFSAEYRVRIFNALPAERKAEIWHARLQQSLSLPLTVAQKKLVEEAIGFVTPERYRKHERFPAGWQEQVRKEFTNDQVVEIFQSLGPTQEDPEDGPLMPLCDCNGNGGNSDCRYYPKIYCHLGAGLCNPTVQGCGIGGLDQCTDHCESTP